MMASMAFWDAANLDPEDDINRSIWTTSRAALDLPWVPDLAGSRWRDPGSVFVVGLAYSPFVTGHAGRLRSMKLADYDPSAEPFEF